MAVAPIVFADRVKETSTTTGTGTFSLAGAATGYQTLVAGIGDTKRCIYCIELQNGSEWEVGIGTVADATPDTLTRDEVLYSSNSNSAVDFSSGTKNVFATVAADTAHDHDNLIINGSGRVAQRGSQLGASPTGTISAASAVVTSVSAMTGVREGMSITGTNIPAGTTISTIDSATQLTMSANATGMGSITLTIGPKDDQYIADRWYALTQTTGIRYDRSTGDADTYAIKLTQTQSTAQRMGVAQIVESPSCLPMRSRRVRFQGRLKCSSSQAIRYAILEWTGTADSVTSDVVNDWTSSTYTASNFFLGSNLTVTQVGSITPSAATWTSFQVKGTTGASVNNLIFMVWTEGTAAQNVTLEISECFAREGWLPCEWKSRHFSDEIHMCQRYYETNFTYDSPVVYAGGLGEPYGQGSAASGSNYLTGGWNFKVPKRASPTIGIFNTDGYNKQIRNQITATNFTNTAASVVGNTRVLMYGTAPVSSNSGDLVTVGLTADAEL